MGASAADRARDIHAAFADPSITAVIASIGGDDQSGEVRVDGVAGAISVRY
jgi:muramoyltetrapeptide carboxypeptidase LdcA involved in peptidoglycan recycling